MHVGAHRRRGILVVGIVCAAHALLLSWVMSERDVPGAAQRKAQAVITRWLQPTLPRVEEAPRPVAEVTPAMRKGRRAAAAEASPVESTNGASEVVAPAPSTSPAAESIEAPLRLDGIPQIARDMARRKGIAELADEQVRITPAGPQEQLAAGIASGATGDCLKGGPEGSRAQGFGLLGLPLLAYDAITGRCRR